MNEQAERCRELISALGLAQQRAAWSEQALYHCLDYLGDTQMLDDIAILDAAVHGPQTFSVSYRKPGFGSANGWTLATLGDRDRHKTLRLMPHILDEEAPLDAYTYARDFVIVGIIEPFDTTDYTEPDSAGVRWFVPPNFGDGGGDQPSTYLMLTS
ncbi:hypothetical protein [uncultured Jatrophihabitans sp.]|uniref:hypothetical protein n=1 Tax=uncultured Jatrophihabitans sp. TaxID=1610747 RepID=UPI0035CA113A